ncbi:hypothetical protein F5Y18DRAFT_239392 [Xylariaceae sp. FL1019]|nr:hypothetical protein F5Y18DRAFT_239392 [Xylariaceae sp. FL1019]
MADMATPRVDLEKELTCSICTEIFFQPLTLLDCLHTYCGSCLKEWFEFQYASATTKPDPPPSGTNIYSCPSCRAPVRNTRGNATVTSLLDLYLACHPDKVKPKEEQDEMRRKYKRGDNILPPYRVRGTQREENASNSSSARRRRDHSRSEASRTRSERDSSRDIRPRPRREDERRRGTDLTGMLQPESSSDEQRGNRSESRRRAGTQQVIRDSAAASARQVEHQASIRSLISSSDVDSQDLEREIDDFARQIQEEGLLDGLDLDNIDLTQNDELSRKITEAYRRRQRARPRAESARSSAANITLYRSEAAQSQSRPPITDSHRPASRQRSNSAHVRTPSIGSQSNERSRPPISSARLDVHSDSERRRRRRTSSGARSATDPIRPSTAETRPAARSQTDLTIRSQSSDPAARRPSLVDSRSTSMPIDSSRGSSSGEQALAPSGNGARDLSFSERASAAALSQPTMPPPLLSPIEDPGGEHPRRRRRPSSLVVPQSPLPSLGLLPSPTHQTHHQQPRHQFYPEPSITCSQCQRPHIEYDLHYNCAQCSGGNWNICLGCYRTGKGCLHWFGFGYTAFSKWDRQRVRSERPLDPPHMLTANRYAQPRSAPGGAEGRKTLTTEDPALRLESGMFCARCLVWANECFWRCDYCNDGDWGFCNACVNQGYGCKHPLLPLTYVQPPSSPSPLPSPSLSQNSTPPGSPALRPGNRHRRPRSATLFTGPNALAIGNFRPLVFTTTCDVCQQPIQPADRRYHCNKCTSQVVPDTQPGDYDICLQCYDKLVADGQVSSDNGCEGWRRCLRGHRMSILGFNEGKGGQRRIIMRDIVGGTGLTIEPHESDQTLQRWHWYVNGTKADRVATVDARTKLPEQLQQQHEFPPDGGAGLRGDAKWSWYPAAGADDELMFPRGAEVLEIEDVNGDWCHGSYMGAKGLFPTPYVNF